MNQTTSESGGRLFLDLAKAGTLFTVLTVRTRRRGMYEWRVLELQPEKSGGAVVVIDQSKHREQVWVTPLLKARDVVRFLLTDPTGKPPAPGQESAVTLALQSRPHDERGAMRSLGPEDLGRAFVVERVDPKGWAESRRPMKPTKVVLRPWEGGDPQRVLINEKDIDSLVVDLSQGFSDASHRFAVDDQVVVKPAEPGPLPNRLYTILKATASEVIRSRRATRKD